MQALGSIAAYVLLPFPPTCDPPPCYVKRNYRFRRNIYSFLHQLTQHNCRPMDQVKDSGYSWVVMMAALLSHFMLGMNTFGSISVLTYSWTEIFSISLRTAASAPALLGASMFFTGEL